MRVEEFTNQHAAAAAALDRMHHIRDLVIARTGPPRFAYGDDECLPIRSPDANSRCKCRFSRGRTASNAFTTTTFADARRETIAPASFVAETLAWYTWWRKTSEQSRKVRS